MRLKNILIARFTMKKNEFNRIIFGSLFPKKNLASCLDKKNTEYIYDFSKKYFLSGFVLAGNDFQNNPILLNKLSTHNRKLALKKIVLLDDLRKLEVSLKEKGINYVLMKGVAYESIKLFNSNLRQFRDIDLLVDKADLKEAFECILELDYEYETKLANNKCIHLYNKNHLPVLINKNKTAIELHHRVTNPTIYKECPLTEYFFSNSKKNNIPDIPGLIIHSMYHAFQHHQLKQGPIYIFDVLKLLDRINADQIITNKYIKTMNLEKDLARMIDLKNSIKDKNVLDYSFEQLPEKPNQFYKEKPNDKKYSLLFNNNQSQKLTISLLLEKLRFYKYKYQTNFISLKFILVIILEFIQNLKKIKI